MWIRNFLFTLLISGFLIPGVFGATDSLPSLFDMIYDKSDINVSIVTDVRQLFNKKDDKYMPAEIRFTSQDSLLYSFDGEIRTRGHSRKEICIFPPIKLRVKKDDLKDLNMSKYPTLKVVNTCKHTQQNIDYLFAEFMTYKLFNVVTDRSFRVQLITVSMVDIDEKRKPFTEPGFLIEHEDQMADRQNGDIYKLKYYNDQALQRRAYHLFAMFQYMVGNTDWMVLNAHNIDIIRVPSEAALYPIPFDFDYAGFVDSHYAVPHETLPIKSVRQRFYKGLCMTEDELIDIRKVFLDKKEKIFQTVQEMTMNPALQKSCISYLEDFFEELENDKIAKAIFVNCN